MSALWTRLSSQRWKPPSTGLTNNGNPGRPPCLIQRSYSTTAASRKRWETVKKICKLEEQRWQEKQKWKEMWQAQTCNLVRGDKKKKSLQGWTLGAAREPEVLGEWVKAGKVKSWLTAGWRLLSSAHCWGIHALMQEIVSFMLTLTVTSSVFSATQTNTSVHLQAQTSSTPQVSDHANDSECFCSTRLYFM